MSKMIFYLKIYFMILKQDLKSRMSYRTDFLISIAGMIFTNISGVITFWVVFENFQDIAGYNYYEILFLYGFLLISLTPSQCMLENNWNLQGYLYSGDFIKYSFRPLNIMFYYISETFDVKGIGQFICGIIILVYSWGKLGIPCSLFMVFRCFAGILTASVIMMAILIIAAASCFWTINSSFVMIFAYRLRDYARYPVTIYKPFFKVLFTFIIPLGFATYYPSLFILEYNDVPLLTIISPLISILWLFIGYKLWMYGAKKYVGTGS